MDGVRLVGVVDRNAARAAEIAAAANTVAAGTDWRALDGHVDAVTIAVPTEAHLEVAMAFIERGVHVLVEKPLARTVEEADGWSTRRPRRGVTLAVGHTERFNPAVVAAPAAGCTARGSSRCTAWARSPSAASTSTSSST